MSMPGLCIRRPVSVLMFYTGVLLFGFISAASLRQELFPTIVYPKLSIVTNYENAAPEEIETLITKPIEEAVGSTPGLRGMTSISREGISIVVAEFGWNQKMDFAALNVREKIDLMKARLPRDAEEPTVLKFNPFEKPILKLSVSSSARSPVQLKRFTEKWFKDEIEKVTGVASATLSGGEDEEILVEVDQGRLKATNVGINDISKALSASNLNYPGGTIKESFYEYLVRTIGEFASVDEIGKVALTKERETHPQGQEEEEFEPQLVLLKDVAKITRTVQSRTSFSRYDGFENITLSVQKQANANTISVVNAILDRLGEMKAQMPDDIRMDIIFNQAEFIQEAIRGVRDAALQGGMLAFLVLLLFLRNPLFSLLVVVITPISIIWTFTIMYFMNISLNIISLGGIALSVGMRIDVAIVVIENVFRRIKENPHGDFKQEVEAACREVMVPLLASTLTTIVVFLPMIFVVGIVGQLIKDLAWVIVVMQLLSFVIAFTLIPVLIVKFGSSIQKSAARGEMSSGGMLGSILALLGQPLEWVQGSYRAVLPFFLKLRILSLLCVFGIFCLSVLIMTQLDRIVMPRVDQGQFVIKTDMPAGTRVEVTNNVAWVIERYLNTLKDVDHISVIVGSQKAASSKEVIQRIGSHQAEVTVSLREGRGRSTDDVIQHLIEHFSSESFRPLLRGARLTYSLSDSLFSIGGEEDTAPIVVDVKGNNMDLLKDFSESVQEKLSGISGIYDVSTTFPESSPETKIKVNKDKASFYRLSVTDLATAAHISIRGIVATKFKEENREIPIRVVLEEHERDAVSKLPFILMHSPLDINVPLAELVTFTRGRGPSEIRRINQERTVQVLGKIYERPLKEVTQDVNALLEEQDVPEGYDLRLAGTSLEVEESFASLRFALILSILLVYMIMAAQFESYFQPFVIMFTVPLALIGVACALWITNTPISVVVLLGIIFLGGIVVNNAIILIDFINIRVREGVPVFEAAIQGCSVRLRPILMTAFTSILGLLPLALGLGKGVELLSPMGITQMGGLLISTLLSLLVIPAIYLTTYGIFKKRIKDVSDDRTSGTVSTGPSASPDAR